MNLIVFFAIVFSVVFLFPHIPVWVGQAILTMIGVGFVLGVIAWLIK